MQDTILKGTGNSRSIKAATTIPATWEAFRAQLISSGIPIDLGALNPTGCTTVGTALNKANLLSDQTASALGLGESNNPNLNDALSRLNTLIATAQATANGRVQIGYGSYAGTGNTSKTVNTGFEANVLIVVGNESLAAFVRPASSVAVSTEYSGYIQLRDVSVTWSIRSIKWSHAQQSAYALNYSGRNYWYAYFA